MDYRIVIWGADDSNVLGLLRAFRDYSYSVLALFIGRKSHIASSSKYCHKPVFVSRYHDGLDFLLRIGMASNVKPFLITSTDLVAEFVDNNQAKLSSYYNLSGTKVPGILTKVLDKNEMGRMAERIGFTIPKSVSISYEIQDSPIGYPCLVKPHKNRFDHAKEFKTKVCFNQEELLGLLATVNHDSKFVLQEYIEKEYDLLVYGCRLYNGETVLAGAFKKDRWYKHADGSHGYISANVPHFIKTSLITKFLDQISYYGLFSFEFGIKNGIAYFYEVNLRNDGTSHYFLQAGTNLPLIWVTQFEDVDRKRFINPHDGEFIDEVYDCLNVKDGFVDNKVWKSQRRASSIYRYYDKNDRVPYLIQMCEKYIKQFLMPIKPIILKVLKRH